MSEGNEGPERGTGKVMGMARESVRSWLLRAAEHIGPGEEFTRAEVKAFFVDEGLPEGLAENLLWAFTRLPHVRRIDQGRWKLSPRVERYIIHRDWRMPTGRLDLASAEALVDVVNDAKGRGIPIPERLQALRDRAAEHIEHLNRA